MYIFSTFIEHTSTWKIDRKIEKNIKVISRQPFHLCLKIILKLVNIRSSKNNSNLRQGKKRTKEKERKIVIGYIFFNIELEKKEWNLIG